MSVTSPQDDNDDVHLQAKVAVLMERTGTLRDTVERHENIIDGVFKRLGKIERLIYIGLGGLLALSGIASFFGWNILKLLGH